MTADELQKKVERVRELSRRLHTSVQVTLARQCPELSSSLQSAVVSPSLLAGLIERAFEDRFAPGQRALLIHATRYLRVGDHAYEWGRAPDPWESALDAELVRARCDEAIAALERLCGQVETPGAAGALERFPSWIERPAREPRRVQPGEASLRAERLPSRRDGNTLMTFACVHGHEVEPSAFFERVDEGLRQGRLEVQLGQEGGPTMHLLMNASRALVCFSENPDGDGPWLTAVDPEAGTQIEEFEHENQVQAEFPARTTIALEKALAALRYLYEHAEPDPALSWEI